VPPDLAGTVFVEVSAAVRDSLVAVTPREDLIALLSTLDPEDLGYVSESLSEEVVDELSEALGSSDRTVFEDSIQYAEDSVGRYMGRELVVVPDTHSLEQVLIDLRQRGDLPPQTDRVFVTDARHVPRGSVPLQVLLLRDPSSSVTSAMSDDTISFSPHDDARDAVKTFERYDLVSAPSSMNVASLSVDSRSTLPWIFCATSRTFRPCRTPASVATKICLQLRGIALATAGRGWL
jgi:magnesium transporter